MMRGPEAHGFSSQQRGPGPVIADCCVRRALVVCAGVLGVLLLGSAARADIHAVAKPTTQTVPISKAAGAL